MKRHILLLSAAILLMGGLAACTSTPKQECWKSKNTKVSKDCNPGNSGASISNPGIKGKLSKRSDTKDTVASPNPDTPQNPDANHGGTNQNNPDQDNSPTNDTDSEPNVPDQDNNANPTNQSNSNDIKGYDPFGGLYGPGT